MKRTIGLTGTVSTLIGYVVGASIFILPGELAASAGPAVFVAYFLAAIPAALTCFVGAQIGSAFPVSGATYVAVSRVVSPLWGFTAVWAFLAAAGIGIALLAYGFADYLAFFIPIPNRSLVAFAIVIAFTALNFLGARAAIGAQGIMVVGFLLALTVFGLGGIANMDSARLVPLFPLGFAPIAYAAIPAYFSFLGFGVIIELGGEIKRPGRTIPIALAASFVCVLFFYGLVSIALPGLVPWTELGDTVAPLATAAATFLPRWTASLISLGALLAAATTLNGILLSQSRDIFALAKDRVLPRTFAHIHSRFDSPDRAILAMGVIAVIAVMLGASITQYATLAVMCYMVIQILASIAVLLMPQRSPERFEQSEFRLGRFWRIVTAGGLILYSAIFMIAAGFQSLRAAGILVLVLGLGFAYFAGRRWWLKRSGVLMEDLLRRDLEETDREAL